MKKFIAITLLILHMCCISVLGIPNNLVKQNELVEIYKIAFQSFMPKVYELKKNRIYCCEYKVGSFQ